MTTITATTTRTTLGKKGGILGDEKYLKRRKQKKVERLRQALSLFGVTLMVLAYTWWSLLAIPEVESGSAAFRPVNQVRRRPQRQQRVRPEEGEESSGGLFGGVGNLFGGNKRIEELEKLLEEADESVRLNKNNGMRWVRAELLPALHRNEQKPLLKYTPKDRQKGKSLFSKSPDMFFQVHRARKTLMAWEKEELPNRQNMVDFTTHEYEYPETIMEPPVLLGDYPKLVPLKELMAKWPQDDIDNPPTPFQETLIHFDYTNPKELEAARKFRDEKLPFKLINVPEVASAGERWTDDYVTEQFDNSHDGGKRKSSIPPAKGTCQESTDNFFAFFAVGSWAVDVMGIPPTRNNDWTYEKWANHAKYADSIGLSPHQPHFYWQAGVSREERYLDESQWTFISRDLPSFSSPEETFFVFEPKSQKGIQCRFGERGVTAATHFDAGRNMVAMVTGAKRYILSPPNQCQYMGIVTERGNPIFRHSMLNFGHLNHMEEEGMPQQEREWMERSGEAMALDTVLKAGEVLYIPSHWFHYITSLQKSAQCNVRSGVDTDGDAVFGGKEDVTFRCVPTEN
jgi:hypothetical protein